MFTVFSLHAMQMEFSFGPKGWVPAEQLQEKSTDECVYALGLHAPGFFDKVLNVNKCLLQSDSANEVWYVPLNVARFLVAKHLPFSLLF